MIKRRNDVPPMTDDPEFAAEYQLRTKLLTQLNEIEQAVSDAQTRTTPNGSTLLHTQAMAMVAGGDGGVAVAEPAVDLAELTHRLRVTREAVEIQTRRLRTAESAVNARVIESLRPAHSALLGQIAEKAAGVGRLCDEEQEYRDSLIRAGYSVGALKPCVLGGMSLKDEYSRLNRFLNEVERDHGVKVKR